MLEIYEECAKLLQAGRDVVLATVFEARGSAPRTAGAKMLVREDGSILGTIGGGRLEHDAVEVARRLFDSRQSVIHRFELTGNDVAAMDMICGGSGEVWLQLLTAADRNNLIVCQATAGALGRRESGWLITEIGSRDNVADRQFCLIGADRSVTGRLHRESDQVDEWLASAGKLPAHTEVAA